jgi:predicted dehydrogenase
LAEAHVYSDHHTLLAGENLDGVVINTPHATHFPIAVACLEHGLHVLVEKPVACSVAEAWQLRDRVRESGRLLIVAYQRRYDSAYRYVRQTIAEGCLGRLVAVNGYQT